MPRIESQAAPEPSGLRAGLHRLSFIIVTVIVLFAPVPYGSKAPFWLVIWTALAGLALLLADVGRLGRAGAWLLCGAFLVFIAYVMVAFLQSAVPAVLPLDIWAQTWKTLGESGNDLSVAVRDAPVLFFPRPLLLLCVFCCGVIFSPDQKRALWLLRAVGLFTCIGGLIGLVALLFEIHELRPAEQGGSLVAFFVNRNTSATYLGSGFLVLFSILVLRFREALRGSDFGQAWRQMYARTENKVLLSGAAILFVLLPLTLSRAGLGLTVILATVTCGVLFVRRIRRWRSALILTLALFGLVYVLSGDQWRQRQALVGLDAASRFITYKIMAGSIPEHPLLGFGLGTFASVFPSVRTEELGPTGVWDLGHSTPLELAFEGGIPLTLAVFSFFILCGVLLVRGLRRRPRDPCILAALLVGLLGALHSSIDFSLQLPGYAVVYMAITGLGVGRALLAAQPRSGRRSSSRRKMAEAVQEKVESGTV